VVKQCPPIPDILTAPCVPPPPRFDTNGDLARAYLDATACLREDAVKLEAIRSLAGCRVEVKE